MTPQEAGFDGAKGINMKLSQIPGGGILKLRRCVNAPWEYDEDCQNALLWQTSEPPHLFYCNPDGDWFELSFTPVQPQWSDQLPVNS